MSGGANVLEPCSLHSIGRDGSMKGRGKMEAEREREERTRGR